MITMKDFHEALGCENCRDANREDLFKRACCQSPKVVEQAQGGRCLNLRPRKEIPCLENIH